MESVSKKLGANIKSVRTAKNMSQGDIAKRLGVGRGYISNIENGKRNPTLATIERVANALEVSINKLLS